MEKFKLSNLRELSTEDQLNLSGGYGTNTACSSCSCSCTKKTPSATKNEVVDGLKEGIKK